MTGGTPWRNPRLSGRIPELDGIRGIAISLVIIRHCVSTIAQATPKSPMAYALASLRLSWSGVDLFFVLSGFLIGGILWDARQSQNYFSAFYMRRIYRIWPVLFLWLSIYLLAAPISSLPVWVRIFGRQIPAWSYALFVQNIVMTLKKTYGAEWLAVTWSLAVEEQFYLILPILVFVIPSAKKLAVAVGAATLAAFVFRTWAAWQGDFFYGPYMLLPCRADALGCGILLALAVRERRIWDWLESHMAAVRLSAVILTLGLIPCLKYPLGTWFMTTVGHTWLALFYSAFILLALLKSPVALGHILLFAPLRSLGTIAYSLYIFHQGLLFAFHAFVFHRAPRIANLNELIVTAASLGFSIVLATISWKWMEKPLLRHASLRHMYLRRPEPVAAVLS